MTPSEDARTIMLRAGLHAKDAIIAALKLSEPADWDSIIRAVERLAASRRWEAKQVAALEVKNIALYDENLKLRDQVGEHIRRINTLSAQRDQLDAENLRLREQAGDMAEDLERANDQIRRVAGTD